MAALASALVSFSSLPRPLYQHRSMADPPRRRVGRWVKGGRRRARGCGQCGAWLGGGWLCAHSGTTRGARTMLAAVATATVAAAAPLAARAAAHARACVILAACSSARAAAACIGAACTLKVVPPAVARSRRLRFHLHCSPHRRPCCRPCCRLHHRLRHCLHISPCRRCLRHRLLPHHLCCNTVASASTHRCLARAHRERVPPLPRPSPAISASASAPRRSRRQLPASPTTTANRNLQRAVCCIKPLPSFRSQSLAPRRTAVLPRRIGNESLRYPGRQQKRLSADVLRFAEFNQTRI